MAQFHGLNVPYHTPRHPCVYTCLPACLLYHHSGVALCGSRDIKIQELSPSLLIASSNSFVSFPSLNYLFTVKQNRFLLMLRQPGTSGLDYLKKLVFSKQVRAQGLCESRGGRPGLPVPNSTYGLCGRKALSLIHI